MPTSIRDVAARANVSVSTVSKVMNDVPSRIPADTRENIRRVALAMGYAPNRLARSLGRRRTDTIGLMISGLRNPFFVDLAETAEATLLERGYQVLLEAAPSHRGTYKNHSKLRGWPVDGILIWASPEELLSDYLGAQAEGLPTVYLGYLRPNDPGSDAVGCDLYAGGKLIADHFIARGYGLGGGRGVVSIGPFTQADGILNFGPVHENNRQLAIFEAYKEQGGVVELVALPEFEETREAGYFLGQQMAARSAHERPRAVFCHNDVVAIGFYRALRRAGIRVPEDIAVAGFDGIAESRFLEDPLTTIEMPTTGICRTAVDLLLDSLGGRETDILSRSTGKQIALPPKLFIGGTT